jgi:hypothetical protein
MDCGLNKEKLRGSLTKSPQRTGTRGYRLSDLDLAARTRFVLDLISRVGFRSGSSGREGVRAAVGLAGAELLRRGFAGAGRSRGYRGSFGLRFGAKERARHAWSTGVDSVVLRGAERGARRWGRLGAVELAGMRAFQCFQSGFWAGSS